ncbi:MAG: enoyl-CoA hydratase-related protein, partial [Pseudomonadota bacterium]|nr:enoyl-CoA hydratase-related protein [Pseudomonadota bacterium]
MPEKMSDVVAYEVTADGIAVIRADNPPVNALGYQTRLGLWNAIEKFDADPSAKIALIHCDGRTFFAGADISEFGGVRADPLLTQVCDRYEAATKPVVASMHGTSLGGGFEMGLASHYRIAQKGSKVGLPEVHLGIIPGAGGTQRAPRVMGAANALEAITSGRHIPA